MYKLRKYHGDRVMSLTHEDDNQAFSVGIIAEGEFEFGAIVDEHYRVTSGKISFWEEGLDEWKTCETGEEFTAHAHKNFKLKADDVSSYICFYK
jgi:uncharacterized protein YaiE (UPF0345 family)